MNLLKSILYYGFIIFLLVYILLVSLNPEKMLDVLGFRTYIVLSESMEPKINTNDMIFSKRVAKQDLEVGDIITFEVYIPEFKEEVFVTHYVGELQEIGDTLIIKTRGYNVPIDQFDSWVDEDGDIFDVTFEDIKGEYMFRIPYIGHIQSVFNDKIMLGLILINVGIVYIVFKLLNRKDKYKFEDDELL